MGLAQLGEGQTNDNKSLAGGIDRKGEADAERRRPQPSPRRRPEGARRNRRRPTILFQWHQFAPYQIDRLEAVYNAQITDLDIVGIAICSRSRTYPWEPPASRLVTTYELITDEKFEDTGTLKRIYRRLTEIKKYKIKHAFLCNYDYVDTLVHALVLKLFGARVSIMFESKFDDKPRSIWREWLKSLFLLPYDAALVGGERNREYAEFLGIRADRIFEGYDSVSVSRIQALAAIPAAPAGTPFPARHFTVVARYVPKKNLFLAIEAYEHYRQEAGAAARALHLCGTGELEEELKADVVRRGLTGVYFRGFLDAAGVAKELGSTLALILPSIEEQWGLVVNEALAMGVPILCSDNVGARDSLVRSAVNGYVFEPDNAKGLACLMMRLATDELEWRRMAEAAIVFSHKGDACQFASAVEKVLAS